MKARGTGRTRALLCLSLLVAVSALPAGCGGAGKTGSGAPATLGSGQGVSITYWTGFTGRELGVVRKAVAGFEKLNPNIRVETLGGINDDKIIASIRDGRPPDVALSFSTDNTGAFCSSGAFQDLGPYLERDHVDLDQIPDAPREYTEYNGTRCAMPLLADVYGLYYNTEMFRAAGIRGPPRTISQLTADAKKLTKRNGDGFDVVGFDPFIGFYENAAAHYAPSWNAHWQDAAGDSTLAASPGWAKMGIWVKKLVDYYGYDRLLRFQAGLGDEFSAQNAFETGRLAMVMDGEYRTAFLAAEHPELKYATAPMPVDDSQPYLYGGGYTSGSILGIPEGAANPAAAWELIRYLSTNTNAEVALANGLANVPSWKPALASPRLKRTPQFSVLLDIASNLNTQTNPVTPSGSANQRLTDNYLGAYQAGNGGEIHDGLSGVDRRIDARNEQAGGHTGLP